MGTPRSRIVRALALLVVIPAIIGGVVATALIAAGLDVTSGSIGSGQHGFSLERDHLQPIPIPASACAYLDAVRTTAATSGADSMRMVEAVDSRRPAKIALPAHYADHLTAFDLALRVTATKVPARLRVKLTVVAEKVEAGRRALRDAPDAQTYVYRTILPMADGVFALQGASDLVGDACGFVLAHDYLL